MHDAFERLGLAADASELDIKRAYARLLKACRPDEDPVAFQQLHDDYQSALSICRARQPDGQAVRMPTPPTTSPAGPDAPASSGPLAASAPLDFPTFMRELSVQGILDDPLRLRRWLDGRPEFWSLDTKQSTGRSLLLAMTEEPLPLSNANFDTLMAFFGLDELVRGIDPALVVLLRRRCQTSYAPVGLFLAQHVSRTPTDTLSPHYVARTFLSTWADMLRAGNASQLGAWLTLTTLLWDALDTTQASRDVLEIVRTQRPAMTSASYDVMAAFFDWPRDALATHDMTQAQAKSDRHLAWLMSDSQRNELARTVKPPKDRYVDVQLAQKACQLLKRPFSWTYTLWLCLSLHIPGHLHVFLSRLREACGIGPSEASVLDRYFDARAVRFWSDAGDTRRMSAARGLMYLARTQFVLLLEAIALLSLGPFFGVPLHAISRWAPVMLATLACGIAWYTFDALLFWQRRPPPAHPAGRVAHAALIPFLAGITAAAGLAWPAWYAPTEGAAIVVLLFAALRYVSGDAERRVGAIVLIAMPFLAEYLLRSRHFLNDVDLPLLKWTLEPFCLAAVAIVFWLQCPRPPSASPDAPAA